VPCPLFDASDLRVTYDKASDWLSGSATLGEAVAAMLTHARLWRKTTPLHRLGSATTTLRQDYRLTG
jgi:hypothetical protein